MLQRIKFAQLLAQQQQSGRLGSLPSVKYNAATQREDTHWERTTIHCITFLIIPPLLAGEYQSQQAKKWSLSLKSSLI